MILLEWFLDKLTNVEVLQKKLSEKEQEEREHNRKDIKVYRHADIVRPLQLLIAMTV